MANKEEGMSSNTNETPKVKNSNYARQAQEITPDIFNGSTKLNLKDFLFKILSGSAQGILIGVLPSAVLKYVLKFFIVAGTSNWASELNTILILFQSFIPFLIGVAIALQFKMKPIDVGSVGLAVAASSGAIKWVSTGINPITGKSASPLFIASGAGDVINAMIVSGIAVLAVWLISKYLNGFGSLAIILTPIVVGGGVGLIGLKLLPYVSMITKWIGDVVETFTKLQPIPMTILISIAFSIIIVTPVSTVGIALAISLSGIGSGAASVGIAATTIVLLLNSWKINKPGTTIAIALGAMKGMMPSVFKKPVSMFSFALAAAISAIPISIFNVQGTPTSAGFGYIGLVGPIQSMVEAPADATFQNHVISGGVALIVWVIVPILAAILAQFIFTKIIKLYSPEDFRQEI